MQGPTTDSLLVIAIISTISGGLTANIQETVPVNNLFSASVYKEVLKNSDHENFIVSPFSAEVILALTQSGAKGETKQELTSALHFSDDQAMAENKYKERISTVKGDEFYTLKTANKIYAKNGFHINESFKKIAADVYHSEIEGIDFVPEAKAAAIMNKWVEEQTENRIKDLVNPEVLNPGTSLVLINALYFKASWTAPFSLSATSKRDFYKTAKDVVKVDTMYESGYYDYYESSEMNAKLLQLPFVGNDASLVIVLPNEQEGLTSLENQIDKVFVQPKFNTEYVDVGLPKFKIDTKIDFVKILKNLGVTKVFAAGKADLSGISGKSGDLFVSDVLQKAFIDVNEHGVEAAAATYVIGGFRISNEPEPEPKKFIADHPFIFYLKFKDMILFVGKVANIN